MKQSVQKFGRFLSGMVMPNIGAFIAWGIVCALFIETGWLPNEQLVQLSAPMLSYLLPVLVAYQGGKIVGGDRGGVIGAIAVIGVICGAPDTPMLMGAMVAGPLAGLVISKFDKFMESRMPAGFEMLINNFSIGILGVVLAIIGFFAIGPFMALILSFLSAGVAILVENSLLPLVAIFIEPAKVLFLNNAINHGIFTPLGVEQVAEMGKSIMYMLETNPGPGLGVLLAYCLCSKDKVAKASAPGAVIVHFFGGIHEIYFPYILMNPVVIIAPIVGNIAAIFFYVLTGAGLSGAPSPGSIIAFLAMTPKSDMLIAIIGVLIATAVSFLIAAPIVRNAAGKSLEDAKNQSKELKNKKEADAVNIDTAGLSHIVFSCDAGMGSSALGATKFKNRIKDIAPEIKVTNSPVNNVPKTANIVVCQSVLKERAEINAPWANVISIENFLADPNLDALYQSVIDSTKKTETSAAKVETPVVEAPVVETPETNDIFHLEPKNIMLGLESVSKEEAIRMAGRKLVELGCADESYIEAMIERENLVTTYMGLGVAIPHGTTEAKNAVKNTGIVCLQFPNGVDFGDEKATLLYGLACKEGEHVDMLAGIADVLENDDLLETLKNTNDINVMLNMFKN